MIGIESQSEWMIGTENWATKICTHYKKWTSNIVLDFQYIRILFTFNYNSCASVVCADVCFCVRFSMQAVVYHVACFCVWGFQCKWLCIMLYVFVCEVFSASGCVSCRVFLCEVFSASGCVSCFVFLCEVFSASGCVLCCMFLCLRFSVQVVVYRVACFCVRFSVQVVVCPVVCVCKIWAYPVWLMGCWNPRTN